MAVIVTLIVVTLPVPSFLMSISLNRAERIVPPEMIILMMQAKDTGTARLSYILGQAEPSRPSGSPRLIKEM